MGRVKAMAEMVERSRRARVALDKAATGRAAYLYCDCCGIVVAGGGAKTLIELRLMMIKRGWTCNIDDNIDACLLCVLDASTKILVGQAKKAAGV